MLAEADFNPRKLCMRHAATTPGRFTLLPKEDVLTTATLNWRMPKYVTRRQLDKIGLILKMISGV